MQATMAQLLRPGNKGSWCNILEQPGQGLADESRYREHSMATNSSQRPRRQLPAAPVGTVPVTSFLSIL
jgi:hypothetical protein